MTTLKSTKLKKFKSMAFWAFFFVNRKKKWAIPVRKNGGYVKSAMTYRITFRKENFSVITWPAFILVYLLANLHTRKHAFHLFHSC
jgi:hypothetical protein